MPSSHVCARHACLQSFACDVDIEDLGLSTYKSLADMPPASPAADSCASSCGDSSGASTLSAGSQAEEPPLEVGAPCMLLPAASRRYLVAACPLPRC